MAKNYFKRKTVMWF